MHDTLRRFFALAMALAMVLTLLPAGALQARAAEGDSLVYLKPSTNWQEGNARFAAYFFGKAEADPIWTDLTDADGDGYWECAVPEGYPSVIFCRMNPAEALNDWPNKWNQTADLTLPGSEANCCTLTEGAWDQDAGSWSLYTPQPSVPVQDYYLIGYINGANYGCEEDYANLGEYKFVGGKLTATFTQDSYVFVKTGDNNSWFMSEAYSEGPSVTLKNTAEGTSEKMKVPGGVEVTFTLVENEDGSLSLSYAEAAQAPSQEYYLVGYINGADYGCEDDYANIGEYKFVGGKLVATFTQDSYVFVKTGDNNSWFMAETYSPGPSVTLKPSSDTVKEKMLVPGGVEVTFTLVVNDDGSLSLEYTVPAPEKTYTYILHYSNPNGWTSVNTYTWAGSAQPTGAWPGSPAAANADNDGWYDMTVTAPEATLGLIFNNGEGAQTSDLSVSIPDGAAKVEAWITEAVAYEAPETWVSEPEVTIHFYNEGSWTGVNAYLWLDGDAAIPGYESYKSWPGKPVSANPAHEGWYDLIVKTDNAAGFNFIFNGSGGQTSDMATGPFSGSTELWVIGGQVLTEAPGEWGGSYTYDVTIHFHNTGAWQTVNTKFGMNDSWDAVPGFENYKNDEFGGAMEANSANTGWYTLSFQIKNAKEGTALNGLFNNGSWGEGNQTPNWTTGPLVSGENVFWYDGELSTQAPQSWADPNRKAYVPGTFPGPSWDAGSNEMTYDAALGLYTYTFKNVPPANYEYKISINGSWTENYGANGVPGGSNMPVAVPETMDVTVYYSDWSHRSVTSVTYVFADISLAGTGIPQGTKLTDPGLTGIYSAAVALEAGKYEGLTMTVGGETFQISPFELAEAKTVNFYFDPASKLYYNDASEDKIGADAIFFDSKDTAYKAPFGAVAVGQDVTFTIETGADVTDAKLVVKGVDTYNMTQPEAIAYELGSKKWTCTVSFPKMGEYDYYFALSNGSDVKVYGDDDGYYGTGTVSDLTSVMPYDLVVHQADFTTPDWMKNAVIYQIFPDRFFDGDVTNNMAQATARGDVNYEYVENWYTLPENPEQEQLNPDSYPANAFRGDGEWSNEIYGGDLQGIIQKMDYLKALGVNVIYLNPVFSSISSHRYDACDYMEIDPILGTEGDFEALVQAAEDNGMHIILDGVFNHVSDDSIYFDRYYKFLNLPDNNKIGAYPYWAYVYDCMNEQGMTQAEAEAEAKAFFSEEFGITDYAYTEWFQVNNSQLIDTDGNAAVDTMGLRAGKSVYSYQGWWGYDSMPVILSTNGSEYQTGNWADEIIDGTGSVTQYWITKGNDGWRLDVANEVSDETWQQFRKSVHAVNSDAVIVGEIWDDATKYLMGDMYDSVMNYLFRNAVTGFAKGEKNADQATNELERIRERYPQEAFYAMMNLVGSHDTTRLLSYLDGIADDRSDKTVAAAYPTYEATSDAAKQMQYLVAFLQFTYPGAPTIYYGDEIGMVGADDPDDRRAMEWGKGNQQLVEWYAKLAAVREAYPALRTGSLNVIDTSNSHLMGYERSLNGQTLVVLANNAASAQTLILEGSYTDILTGAAYTGTVPARSGVILVAADSYTAVTINAQALACAYTGTVAASRPVQIHHHSYTAAVVEPTASSRGYTLHTCECGNSYKDTFVAKLTVSIERLSGKTRIETAQKTADALKEAWKLNAFDTILLASGANFPDALTGSYLATVKKAPILLHYGDSIQANLDYIQKNLSKTGKVLILGGTASVPAEMENALMEAGIAFERVKGATRFDTNLAILEAAGVSGKEILVTTGWEFADSLSVSALGLPVLLVNSKGNALTPAQIDFLKANADNTYTIIGGTAAVSADLEAAIAEHVNTEVKRISGKTREATSVAVAEQFCAKASTAVLAFSRNFPDGLCGGPLAWALGAPLLLTNVGYEQVTNGYISAKGITSGYVIGGSAALSDATVNAAFGITQ